MGGEHIHLKNVPIGGHLAPVGFGAAGEGDRDSCQLDCVVVLGWHPPIHPGIKEEKTFYTTTLFFRYIGKNSINLAF